MTKDQSGVWTPSANDIESAKVTELGRLLGVSDYDALYRLSIDEPERYWKTVTDYCGIVWQRPYDRLVDLSDGVEFPRWFVGGELNWVDSILARAVDPDLHDRPAIVAEHEDGTVGSISYRELPDAVGRFAGGLAALGVGRGDRVGLLMETGIESIVSLLALSHIGAIAVPLFSGFGVDAIVARLASCSATALLGTTGFHRRGRWIGVLAHLREAAASLPDLSSIIIKRRPSDEELPAGWHDWNAVSASGAAQAAKEPARMSPDDPFMIIYTSGTTGKPKGAVHTHGGFPIRIAHDAAVHFNVGRGDVFCWPADMGWIAGALVATTALMRGAMLVCYDGAPDFPDWSRMSRLIERHRITHYGSAPTLIRGLAANAAVSMQGDLSSVRLLITAGEGIDPEHFQWYQQNFGHGAAPVINYTGGTEVSGALLSSVVVKPIVPSGFNTASPGIVVDVVDEAGRSLTGQIGELAVLGPFIGMTKAFWQDRERYLDSYWRTIPGMWIHGDLVIRDGDGNHFLRGRSDDTLKVAGKRLGPAEVEDVLLELPDIAEAAAIGVDDAVKGQKLVVFVVPATDGARDDAALSTAAGKHIELRLGKPFRPERVHVVSQIPKTRTSKSMRRVIRNIYQNRPPGDLTALSNPDALDEIKAAIGQ
ncbi:AMP-binding protein [Azospirillum endophyticum]